MAFRLVGTDYLNKTQRKAISRHSESFTSKCECCDNIVDYYMCGGVHKYAYKLDKKYKSRKGCTKEDMYYIFCSWSCLRKFEKENQDKLPKKINIR